MTELAQVCARRVAARLDDMRLAPSVEAFLDLGTVAETLLVSDDRLFEPLRGDIAKGVRAWAGSDLLRRIVASGPQYLYYAAVLVDLAHRQGCWGKEETAALAPLFARGLAGRGELAGLTLGCAAAHLAEVGIALETFDPDSPIAYSLDKSVLRRRADERDLMSIVQLAGLRRLGRLGDEAIPRIMPAVLMLQAVRSGQLNWLATLILAQTVLAGTDDGLVRAAHDHLRRTAAGQATLVAPPAIAGSENTFLERAELGLRLRGSLALCMLMDGS